MLKKLLTCPLFFALIISTAGFTQEFAPNCFIDTQQPSWVQGLSLDKEEHPNIEKGQNYEFVLVDIQLHLDLETRFSHFAKRLLNQNGVQEHSQIEIEFDPSYESLILHKIFIHRHQATYDKISSCHMEVIQQEQDLDYQLYNGRKKWVIFLEDVQPGDIIEYAFSKKGKNPVFKGIADGTIGLEHEEPILYSFFRIIDENQRPLFFRPHNTSLVPTLLPFPGRQEWTWELRNSAPSQYDPLCPSWFSPEPAMQISEFKNWEEVALWGTKMFGVSGAPSPEMIELVNSWNSLAFSTEEKVLKAIRFVQDEVRYLGFERGIHTHMPMEPNTVFKRRFGDCKDKTLLLKTLLELMHVESYPVLVNSRMKGHISDWHPSPLVFNHVILQICLQGKTYYVDSTHLFEGGCLENLQSSLFQKGLVLSEKTTALTEFSPLLRTPLIMTTTTFEVLNSQEVVICRIKKNFKNLEANYMRTLCTQTKPKEFERYFSDFYAKQYGQLKVIEPLKIQDDRKANQLSLELAFEIPSIWDFNDEKTIKTFKFSPPYIAEACDLNFSLMRQSPLLLEYPFYTIEDFYFVNPEKEWIQDPSKTQFESDEFVFSTAMTPDRHQLHARFEMYTKKGFVPVEGLKSHRALLKKIEDKLFLTLMVPTELGANERTSEEMKTVLKGLVCLIALANLIWYLTKEYKKRKRNILVNQE